MKNKLFKTVLDQIPEHTKEKIKNYTDMIDEIEKIVDEAFKLYMPQVRSEITDLAEFIVNNTGLKDGETINVLEIGTKFGGTFYIWNSINPNGMNISIDMSDGGIHGGVSEEEMDKRDLWFNERFDNCHFIRGNSHETTTSSMLCEILFNKNWNDIDVWTDECKQLDFLFIDGDHSYEGVKKDFYDYISFCKPKSFVCFHDIIISDHHHSRNVYVGEFWNEIKNYYKHWEFVEPGNIWAGIGVIQLP